MIKLIQTTSLYKYTRSEVCLIVIYKACGHTGCRQNCRESESLRRSARVEAVPDGFGPSAVWHDEVRPYEADAAAGGSSGAVLQAGSLGRQRADVGQVAGGHRAAACAARGDVAVQHLAVHHRLLALLVRAARG